MSDGALVVIGDLLLDRDVDGVVERLCPDAPVAVLDERRVDSRPGGAGLAAALAAADGRDVTLVTALADDDGGRELERLLRACGVELVDLGLAGATPEKIRLRSEGRALLRLDRGGAEPSAVGEATAAARAAVAWGEAILVSDYGRGVVEAAGVRQLLAERAACGHPVVWDPHPRGPQPVANVALATPNADEAAQFAAGSGDGVDELASAAAHAADLRARWWARAVCVTRGDRGVLLDSGQGAPLVLGAPRVRGGDPCGAGDRFAASSATALADGASVAAAVELATAEAARFVAAGGAGGFTRRASRARGGGDADGRRARASRADGVVPLRDGLDGVAGPFGRDGADGMAGPFGRDGADGMAGPFGRDGIDAAFACVAATRAAGGVVVAAGGCFDLLHPGHVRLLSAARELGDCLVVCLNSDASVRRLKGPSRPLLPAHERADVLAALACVDAVVAFDEDTPCSLLELLRPDIWVKGGDYAGARLPEADVLARWDGRAVFVPHHAGHSTTRLIEEAIDRAAS